MSKKEKIIYCGIDEPKKDQRRGTAVECAESKQVRYYGLNKVTKEVANEYKGIPVESAKREKRLAKTIGSLRGQIDRFKNDIADYKDEVSYKRNKQYQDAVKILEGKLADAKDKLVKVSKKMKEFMEKEAKKEADKKDSKKDTKKDSKKDSKKDPKKDPKKDSKKDPKKDSKKDSKKDPKKDSKKGSKKKSKK